MPKTKFLSAANQNWARKNPKTSSANHNRVSQCQNIPQPLPKHTLSYNIAGWPLPALGCFSPNSWTVTQPPPNQLRLLLLMTIVGRWARICLFFSKTFRLVCQTAFLWPEEGSVEKYGFWQNFLNSFCFWAKSFRIWHNFSQFFFETALYVSPSIFRGKSFSRETILLFIIFGVWAITFGPLAKRFQQSC